VEIPGVLDFGYALLPVYWGKGYATEALSAIIHFAFEKLNVEQIYGECDFNNPALARVMEKAGLRQIQQVKGGVVEDLKFVITRVEWRSLK
jgi:RimJ/RimL family protein N-acetyltransferase